LDAQSQPVVQLEMAEPSCNRNKINRRIAFAAEGRETDKEEDREAGVQLELRDDDEGPNPERNLSS
jgi:hypothetical protein